MAVRARFGRLPRSAPSLTSTIVSLAAEYQRVRDRNIEDAWKNGGQFEGKKVTDQMLLAHWKERRAGVSHDDPMWDYYNNTISQLEFNIAESKMGQLYAEEKVSDGQMAAFYRKWAAKLPEQSEAYRQLMTQAAKFKSAAAARGRGRSSNNAAIAYGKKQQETYDTHEKPFDYITGAIAAVAQQANLLDEKDLRDPDHGWSKLITAGAETDPERFSDLLNQIMEDPELHARLTLGIKQYADPDFNGVFDEETLSKYARRAGNGARIRADRAHKFGDTKGEKDALKAAGTYGRNNVIIRATLGGPQGAHDGFIENNEAARSALDLVLNDPTKSISEQRDALDGYTKWLAEEGLPDYTALFPAGTFDPFSPNYDPDANGLVARITGTINAANGIPQGQTLKDDLFGFGDQEAGTGSDAFKLGNQALGVRDAMTLVDGGLGKQVKVDDQGRIDPDGTHWGVFRNDDVDLMSANVVPFAVPGANWLGGEVRYTATQPVRVAVYAGVDPNTGRPVGGIEAAESSDPEIGQKIDIVGPGGQSYTMWGVWDKGEMVWTADDPFTNVNRATGFTDDRGNYVVGYVDPAVSEISDMPGAPKPTFNPGAQINRNGLQRRVYDPATDGFIDSVDGTPWNPQTDRDLSFYSPMSAAANSSAASLKWVNAIGPDAVAKSEREWYSEHPDSWSPDMKRMLQKGARPEDVVEAGARMLLNDVAVKNREGFTPESQQASRKSEGVYAASRAAASRGLTLAEYQKEQENVDVASEAKTREDLIAAMNKWGTGFQNVAGARREPGGAVPQESLSQRWITKGWTVADLLSQPGMSIDQANDLAAIISGGAVGSRAPGQGTIPSLPRTGIGVNNNVGPRTGPPPVNPYAPQGVIPNKVTPKPAPAPVEKPKPTVAPPPAITPVKGFVPPSQHDLRNQHGATEFD